MSETEFRVGKVKEVAKDFVSFEDKIRSVSEVFKIPLKELVWEYEGKFQFKDEHIEHEKFVYADKRLFEILEDKDLEGDNLNVVRKIGEDEYEYQLRYYNGGTCFQECLEEGLQLMK